MIHNPPSTEFPPLLTPTPLTENQIAKFRTRVSQVKDSSKPFWNNLINGGFGTDQLRHLEPIFSVCCIMISYLSIECVI